MDPYEIITELKKKKVVPRLYGDQLELTGETQNLSQTLIDCIKASKEELLLLLRNAGEGNFSIPVPVAGTSTAYPVSSAQKRIWIVSQFEGGSSAYNISIGLYISGRIIISKLEEAFRDCIRRHDSLRTVFAVTDGNPVQVVQKDIAFDMEVYDMRSKPDVRDSLKQAMEERACYRFNLEKGPLMRVALFQLSADECALSLVVHHLVSDGWSVRLIIEDVMRAYGAGYGGGSPGYEPLRIQYKDYVYWKEQQLNSHKSRKASEFWRSQFPAHPTALDLPVDFSRPAIQNFEGAVSRFCFEPAMYSGMLAFCKHNGATLFNFLRASLSILLCKLSGQDNIVIGTAVSGRNHADLEKQVGLYVNTLPLVSAINSGDSFLQFLEQVSVSSFRAFEYQDYPLDQIVIDLDLKRDTARNPLFDVMMVLQDTSAADRVAMLNGKSGIELYSLDAYLYPSGCIKEEKRPAKFDLTFNFDKAPGAGFFVEIEYASKLFTAQRIVQFFEVFLHIISQVLENPSKKIRDIEAVNPGERDKILRRFNVPVKTIEEPSITQLLAPGLSRYAEHTAVITVDARISYKELDTLSCQAASRLIPFMYQAQNAFVGLLMERSEWTIIGALGILKAGAAYVALDINYPVSRISYMIEDACPTVIIVDDAGYSRLPGNYKGKIIHVNELKEPGGSPIPEQWAKEDRRENIAYLIYTSGSTGNPKGVAVCHRNTIAFLKWAAAEFADTPFEILYATTSYCFDLSIFEFFLPLLLGKTVRLLPSAAEIPDFISADQKILINTVPSVVRTLLDKAIPWDHVAALNMAGEPVPPKMRRELDFSRMEVRNLYGPSEDTTYSTMYRLKEDGLTGIPIGTPIDDTQLYILDRHKKLVPVGVEGEIYLSGQGVAQGYLNRTRLTAEKFLDNPFVPGMIMYQTGDLGKWLEDGKVEFLGRVDDQAKVRGYRIEPGEIQCLLEKHASVKQAFVTVLDINGSNEIAAYYVSGDGPQDSLLKVYLARHLPAYMIPAYWVLLDKIPLNANGKIDKKQLPHPAGTLQQAQVEWPVTELQQHLWDLWKEVLQVEEPGINRSFFDLGGHSLKAMKLGALISKHLGKDVTLNELFLHPTIEQQANLIGSRPGSGTQFIERVGEQPYYPISIAQERLWVLTRFEEASKAYHMPVVFKVEGGLDVKKLQEAFLRVIEKYEILRTQFAEREGKPVQLVRDTADTGFFIREINADPSWGEEQELQFLQREWASSLNLEDGPLLDCILLRTSRLLLSFNMHHMISDGWSVGVLYRNVISAYRDLIQGGTGLLPKPRIQFRDFAVWQREQLKKENLEADRAYWMSVFEAGVPVLDLPTDFHRPEVKTYRGSVHRFKFTGPLWQGIHELAARSGVSLFVVLMAGVNVLLKKYTNQNDIVVGTPVAAREHHELQDQIGFFVQTLALRTKLDGDLSFSSLMSRQKDIVLKALRHQAFPFGTLIEELNLKRNLSRSPLFDVLLVLKNLDGQEPGEINHISPGLRLEQVPAWSGTAKYDLSFSFEERPDDLLLELEYNIGLFREETVARMAVHLERMFRQVVENPGITIKGITLLDQDEQALLASRADRTQVAYDTTATLVSLFGQAVSRYPHKAALVAGSREITYQELGTLSGQLARALMQEYGVLPGDRIVLYFERNEWLVIGILAVLKAGAAYVPVDPAYPLARANYIINDSGSPLVLFDTEPGEEIRNLWNDRIFVNIREQEYAGDTAVARVDPASLAYVIYTSGTTGDPKGVLVTHQNVTRLLFNQANPFDFHSGDRWPLFHSYCFDVSVWEMYGSMLYGGTLVVVPKEIAQDSIVFYDFLLRNKITVLNQTPTAFRSLMQNNRNRLFTGPAATVRYLIFAGEALMPEILAEWNAAIPSCKLVNMYGITETTVHVTYKEITAEEIKANKSNIGLPLPTLSCYVLDMDLQQVPVGVIGELCVGGAGVAQGYLNKPELTAQRFIAHPFKKDERLYRSGDFARILPSGDIEYIGRRDDQVKIRGHRIELAEVESAICRQEGVKDAIVLPLKNSNGEYDLVAYFIADGYSSQELRKSLAALLPAYMVPSYLISLPAFPLNSNGKLDKHALPAPGEAFHAPTHTPCRNDTDVKLVAIWEEVLDRKGVGISDNFFDLGGHSLKATRVISRMHESFGIKIDMQDLFIEPTIEHLSNYIQTLQLMEVAGEVAVEGGEEITF
jgi:amino acid adenylation domain-containing protein